jgi:hypothetical protein
MSFRHHHHRFSFTTSFVVYLIEHRRRRFWTRFTRGSLIKKGAILMQVFDKHADNATPIKAGDVINYVYQPLKADGSAGTEGSPVTATANDPTLASIQPNTGIGNQTGSIITMLKPGTVTVTMVSTNEAGASYRSDFQIVIAEPPAGPVTDHFNVIEEN